MNKNNGLWIGIAGLIIVAVIVAIVMANKKEPVVNQEMSEPVATTQSQTPVVQKPVVMETEEDSTTESDEIVITTPRVVVTPRTSYVAPRKTGSAPRVLTLGASSISAESTVLNGMLTTNNAETYYSFEYGATTNFGASTRFAPIDGSSHDLAVALVAYKLQPYTTFYYRLNAQNAYGSVHGNTNSFVTPGYDGTISTQSVIAPETNTLGATSISKTSAVLNGSLFTNNMETYYSFEYGTTPSFGSVTRFAPIAGSNSSSTVSLAVYNLNPATKYYYRLNAQNQSRKTSGTTASFVTEQ